MGTLFILFSTVFAIIPATLIRETFNLIETGYKEYINGNLDFKNIIINDVVFYSAAIIISAVFRGILMYMMRQTIIVASRNIEYDLKNEVIIIIRHFQFNFIKIIIQEI